MKSSSIRFLIYLWVGAATLGMGITALSASYSYAGKYSNEVQKYWTSDLPSERPLEEITFQMGFACAFGTVLFTAGAVLITKSLVWIVKELR